MLNNTLAKFTLTALAAFAISACGSSGGGSDDNGSAPANDQAQNQQPTTPAQPSQPAVPTQPTNPAAQPSQPQEQPAVKHNPTDGSLSGTGYLVPKTQGKVQEISLSGDATRNFNKLNVEGKSVDIIPVRPGVTLNVKGTITDDGISYGDNVYRVVGGSWEGSNIRYGLVTHSDFANQYLIAAGKNATAVMPTGTAKYEGGVVHTYSSKKDRSIDKYTTGSSVFHVNFDNKTLSGSVTPNDMEKIHIYATISGNTFDGRLNGTKTEGGFYGQNAQDLTGRYTNDTDQYMGVFGAQKQ